MLPKRKTSKSKTRTRRSHHRLRPVNYSLCQQCGTAKLPHTACGQCGFVNEKITLKLAEEAES
ncbi:MAG: 50S ribosomal protein L32 [Planctomycetales bacterium 4572_13]|nr:MAG: 50S ribosomal protein L32 [Planctomycetales bacterium 4572_13]